MSVATAEAGVSRERSDGLPEGWAAVRLGDIAEPSKERMEPKDKPDLAYLSLEHLEAHGQRIVGYGTASDVRSTKSVFHAGDVLYGKLRPYLNKVAIPEVDGICSTDILVFPRQPWVDSRILLWFLSSPPVVDYADHNSTGVQLPRVSFAKLADMEIPLPPLAEQRRIVAKAEKLLARVNTARERLAGVPVLLARFRQSVLAAACSGRLTAEWRREHPKMERPRNTEPAGLHHDLPEIPDTWAWASLEAVCSEVVDCPHSTPKWSSRGEICLRTTNFRPGSLALSEVRYVSDETYVERTKRLRPRPGDVVYSREGGILGLAAVIPPGAKVCLGQRMMLMRADDEKYIPSLLMNVLNSQLTLARVAALTGGTSSPHLNVADIKLFPLPLPPLQEQHEIVRRVDALFALADAIEGRVAAATARAERLTQSILAKAFRGELVPTEAELARREGRDYEPASVLLERISARAEAKPAPKRRRAKARR